MAVSKAVKAKVRPVKVSAKPKIKLDDSAAPKIKNPVPSSPPVDPSIVQYGRVDLSAPQIGKIIGYRCVWALATLSADKKRLKGTHFTYCTLMGRNPIWGLYEIGGKCIGSYSSKQEIEDKFPAHTWRRIPASFVFNDLAPLDQQVRRSEVEKNLYARNK